MIMSTTRYSFTINTAIVILIIFIMSSCKTYSDIPDVAACYNENSTCISFTNSCYGKYVMFCPVNNSLIGICRNIDGAWADMYYYSPGYTLSTAFGNCHSRGGKWEQP